MNRYSVPVRLIGRPVRVLLHASDLVVFDGRAEVARHERLATRGGFRLDLDHYLEALLRKPGALPGATALEQARAAGKFTPVHDAWWAAVRKAHGDAAGTRALIEVLLLHRHHGARARGRRDRRRARGRGADRRRGRGGGPQGRPGRRPAGTAPTRTPRAAAPTVTSLTERRLAALPADTRPLPSVAAYDQLLHRHAPCRHRQPRRPIMTIARHRGMTEQAADAAIDTACRVLRLPTIRAQFTAVADAAEREQMTYRGFLAELLMAECDDRDRRRSERRIKAAGFPRQKWLQGLRLRRQPEHQPGDRPHPRHLRMGRAKASRSA